MGPGSVRLDSCPVWWPWWRAAEKEGSLRKVTLPAARHGLLRPGLWAALGCWGLSTVDFEVRREQEAARQRGTMAPRFRLWCQLQGSRATNNTNRRAPGVLASVFFFFLVYFSATALACASPCGSVRLPPGGRYLHVGTARWGNARAERG